MYRVLRFCLLLLILINIIKITWCKCSETSFVTTCDSVEDIEKHKSEWSEVVIIGSVNSDPNESVNLERFFLHTVFPKSEKLTSMLVMNRINNLELTPSGTRYCASTPQKHIMDLMSYYGNKMNYIEWGHFPKLKVKKFSLTNNNIEVIKTGAFSNHEIEVFDVSNNSLEIIEWSSLPKTQSTKVIIIRNNKLDFIEPDSFPPGLQSLHLDNNKLRLLSMEVTRNLINLKKLTLSKNKFKEIPKINHMKELTLFDISHNLITSVDNEIFQGLNKLELLNLSYNKIDHPDILKTLLGSLKNPHLKISIAFNSLSSLNLENVSFKANSLILYGNPWSCDWWNKQAKTFVVQQTTCDQNVFSNGVTPYCISYDGLRIYSYTKDIELHQEDFYKAIKNIKDSFDCVLKLNPTVTYSVPPCIA